MNHVRAAAPDNRLSSRHVTGLSWCVMMAVAAGSYPAGSIESQPARVRDSAAVRITENGARAGAPISITLAPTPVFDIGGLKSDPADELTDWLISFNVVRLSDGVRVVGDRVRLRYFDSAGRQVRVSGREGQGPGELANTSSICSTRGDTVVVLDAGNRRISIWDRSGDHVREFQIERGGERMGCFNDGTILLAVWEGNQLRLEHRRLDGTLVRALGLFGGAPQRTAYYNSQTSMAVYGTRFYIGDPRAHEVRGFDQRGQLVSIVRTSDPVERVTASELSNIAPMGGAAGGTTGGARNTAAAPRPPGPVPTVWPAYGQIRLDDDGRLWIQEFRKTQSAPMVWTSFDADGRILGRLTMPAQIKRGDPHLLMFTRDGALVRLEDSDGAVHLVEYPLVRK
jgi:hypothetical protein